MIDKTNAQIALEAASRVYEGKGINGFAGSVLNYADTFLKWLNENS